MPVGRDSPSRRFAWLACLLLILVTAGRIGAQEAPRGAGIAPANYDNPDEIKQLDAVVRSLGGAEGDAGDPQHVNALLELSELLSSPCDQLRWLLAQTGSLAGQHKRDLATSAVTRGDGFSKDERDGCQAELAQLRLMANPPPPVPDPTKSSITAEPAQVEANGKDPATITVTLRDSQQQPVANYDVSLAAVAGVTIDPSVGRSDDAGVVRFTVTSAKEQEAQFVATDPKAEARTNRTGTATVKFTAPPRLPLDKVVEANALKNRLAEPQTKDEAHALPEAGKFALLARGVDDDLIFKKAPLTGGIESQPAWDIPRTVLNELAKRDASLPVAKLPPVGKLLELRQKLFDKYNLAQKESQNLNERQKEAEETFAIAAALLDRALGLDETDLKTVTRQPPFDYASTPEAWAAVAADLEKDSLWRWAALARLLEAAGYSDEPSRQKAAGLSTQQWKDKTRLVLPGDHWRAVDGWIARLAGGDQETAPDLLPLRSNFREAARVRRGVYAKIIEGIPKTDANADELLKNIQLAKAADLLEYIPREEADKRDPAVQPFTLSALKDRLKSPDESRVFIELIEVSSGPGGGAPTFCGVAVTKVGGAGAEPSAVVRQGALASLVRAACERLPKEAKARIVIAPDGALPLNWFQDEECELLPFAGKALTYTGWVVYVPSAPALTASGWTLDKTLRVWYRTALRAGYAPPVVPAYPRDLRELENVPSPYLPADSDNVRTYPVWLEEHKNVPSSFLGLLKAKDDQCKKDQPYRVVPLVVSKGG